MPAIDVLIKNVRAVIPDRASTLNVDIAIADGRFARLAPGIPADAAATVIDGHGKLAFPGVVDGHQHWRRR